MFSNGQDNSVERSLRDYREKIDLMESRLHRYRDETLGYQMMIDALKSEINLKDGELQKLRTSVTASQAENRMLTETLAQKERDLDETLASLNNREREAAVDKKLSDLAQSLRFAEADACYARAQLTEAAANKILFSPARKKEYLSEALEGYKKAFSLGKQEAAQDIFTLQKSLLPKFASAQ
jgi:chromosome segregation ATPase